MDRDRARLFECLWRFLRGLRCLLLAGALERARFYQAGAGRCVPRGEAEEGSNRMSSDILLRSVIALGIIVLGLGIYWLVNQRLLSRARNGVAGLFSTFPNKSVIVYFTTPDCAPC